MSLEKDYINLKFSKVKNWLLIAYITLFCLISLFLFIRFGEIVSLFIGIVIFHFSRSSIKEMNRKISILSLSIYIEETHSNKRTIKSNDKELIEIAQLFRKDD
jgi:hypothetical protein